MQWYQIMHDTRMTTTFCRMAEKLSPINPKHWKCLNRNRKKAMVAELQHTAHTSILSSRAQSKVQLFRAFKHNAPWWDCSMALQSYLRHRAWLPSGGRGDLFQYGSAATSHSAWWKIAAPPPLWLAAKATDEWEGPPWYSHKGTTTHPVEKLTCEWQSWAEGIQRCGS